MEEKKIDRRIIKTKNEIKKSLIDLLINKDISSITVTELTSKSNINRATFYLHYNSVSNVLDDLENELIKRLIDVISSYNILEISTNPYPLLKTLSEELPKYNSLATLLMSEMGGAKLLNKLKLTFKQYIFDSFVKLTNNTDTKTLAKIDRLSTFLMSGTIDTYQNWFNSKTKTISLEELCTEISAIISSSLMAIF